MYVRYMHRLRLTAGSLHAATLDVAVAFVLFVAAELEMALGSNIEGPRWVNILAAAGATLPIAARRRWPLAVAIAVAGVVTAQEALNGDLIETVEATPDTVIKLTTDRRLLVSETPEEIAALVLEHKRLAQSRPHVLTNR